MEQKIKIDFSSITKVNSGMDRKGPGKIEQTDIVPAALHKDLTSGSFGVFTIGAVNQN